MPQDLTKIPRFSPDFFPLGEDQDELVLTPETDLDVRMFTVSDPSTIVLDPIDTYTFLKRKDGKYQPITSYAGGFVVTARGTATLEAGSATIAAPSLKATSVIMLTYRDVKTGVTDPLEAPVATRIVGTSFVATNLVNTDSTSTIDWVVIG